MATSDTFDFNPPIGTLTLNAYSRCRVYRTMLTAQNMEDAYLESNLLQSDWAADGIIWWTVLRVDQPLTAGSPTYAIPTNTTSVLDVYITPGPVGSGSNRLILPFSRTDYASLAQPLSPGFPTSFWYDRALTPTITLWPVPDNSTTYTMSYYIYTQPEDAVLRGGGQAAIPYWWLNAYTADLAHRLSRHLPDLNLEAVRKADRDEAYQRASKQTEPSYMYITPGLANYFRG